MNLTIYQRGLLLVSLPLVFEICFLVLASFFAFSAEQAAEQEQSSKLILAQANELLQDLILLSSSSALFTLTVADEYERQSRDTEAHVADGLAHLEFLVRANPAARVKVEALKSNGAKLLKMIQAGRVAARKDQQAEDSEDIQGEQQSVVRSAIKGALFLYIGKSIRNVRELNDLVVRQAEPLSERARQYTSALHLVLFLGLPLSFAVSFWALRYFSTTICTRLDKVASGTVAFARGEKMNPPLAGIDEIAQLDSAFHRMADQLSESRRKERAIVDHAQDMICALTSDLQFLSANPAARQIFAVDELRLVEQNLKTFLAENSVLPLKAQLDSGNKDKEWTLETELELERSDGSKRWTQWSFVWSPAEQRYFCVCHDASKQKELENLKRDFINMVSHDLRSPITSLHLFLDSMAEGVYGSLPEKLNSNSQTMGRSLQRLLSLINNLLDVEKIEAGRMSLAVAPQRLAEIIEDQILTLMPLIKAQGLDVDLDLDSDLVAVCDQARLHQVLGNLLSNAIKFSPAGSTLTISLKQEDNQVAVRIKDQGPGIAADELPKLFERFQQTASAKTSKTKGTGLGLTLCKKIIELHGGQIGVESEPGHGSCFWFKLPLAKA